MTEKEISDEEAEALKKRAKKQAEALEILNSSDEEIISLQEFSEKHRIARPSLTALEKAGYIEVIDESVHRDPFGGKEFMASEPLKLNEEQEVVLDRIVKSFTPRGGSSTETVVASRRYR